MSEQTESTSAAPAENEKETESGTETKEVKENGAGDAATEPVAEPEPPKEMRAVVLTSFGGLKSVKTLKKPEPTVGEGEVLIRVKAWYVLFTFFFDNTLHVKTGRCR